VRFGTDDNPVILLSGLTKSLGGGQSIPVTFTFAQAGSITVVVPVALTSGAPLNAPTVPVRQTAE